MDKIENNENETVVYSIDKFIDKLEDFDDSDDEIFGINRDVTEIIIPKDVTVIKDSCFCKLCKFKKSSPS